MSSKDIIIICESGEGQMESGNSQLIVAGTKLAQTWGGNLICLLAGDGVMAAENDIKCHVDEVWVADFGDSPYNSTAHFMAAQALVKQVNPRAVLFSHSFIGMDLAPRIAVGLGVPSASNCISLEPKGNSLDVTRPMYGGKIHAKVEMKEAPFVVTIQSRGDDLPSKKKAGVIHKLEVAMEGNEKIRHLRRIAPVNTGVDITKAEIIVSGGRGLGERENYDVVEELASSLGGVPACSRPLVDMGWFDVERQVGMSGKSVKPKLYVACGISGAVEHIHGMKESEVIVAINKDPDAPIFGIAHYGIVGDVMEIMPALIRRLKQG